MSGLARHRPLKQLAAAVLGPPCALLTAPGEPLLASLLLVAQKGGCLHHYQLGKPFKQLSLLMIVTAAVLTCTVLVPPCLFQITFVRFKDGEVGARITPAVTGHGNTLVDLAHPQQHLCQGCPFLSTVCALVGSGANGQEGWKPAQRCGGGGNSSLLRGSFAAADPLQRRFLFHKG